MDIATREAPAAPPPTRPPLEDFERIYRHNVDVVMGYFSRRCREPQLVADLTSETFLRAINGFSGFDARRGSDRAWVFGIATRVFAQHCEQSARGRQAVERLGGRRQLEDDEIEELVRRIDAESDGSALVRRCASMPPLERTAIELVDLAQLSPKEAAEALGISRAAFRKRLSRARSRLTKEQRKQ